MVDKKNPKVFISYSWSCQERVIELAERLVSHGVDVVIDVWDLKEGNDKYYFMEQSVTNEEIDKVLIICDKSYTEKANSKKGGVGDEAMIISSKVYGKVEQEKFIPIIFEFDEDNKAYCPIFIESRIYINLSSDTEQYELEYDKLLRNLFGKPVYRKPSLGEVPEWLENEQVNLSPVRDIIKQVKGNSNKNKNKTDYLIKQAISVFSAALQEHRIDMDSPINNKEFLSKIEEHKILRDLYFEFVETLIFTDMLIEDIIPILFETLYNDTHDYGNRSSYRDCDFENIDYFLWESFIGTTAILLHFEKYSELRTILQHTYFLRSGFYSNANLKAYNYTKFRHHMHYIEKICKPNCEEPKYCSLASQILIGREKKPLITQTSLTQADTLLFQIYYFLGFDQDDYSYWFPNAYIYYKNKRNTWSRLVSKKYCKKILPLFNAGSIVELKQKITEVPRPKDMRYQSCFDDAPWITDYISVDKIGSMN